MAISTTFNYSRKALDNNYDAWITHHMRVRGLMTVGLTLSNARATISTKALAALDFMVNLNKPC
jgi:hypothetical protein